MARQFGRFFSSWPFLLTALLVVILAFIYMSVRKENAKREAVPRAELTVLRENAFAARIIAKYGSSRVIEDRFCLEGGTACMTVEDSIRKDKNSSRYLFERGVIHKDMAHTVMYLKLPEKFSSKYLDTTKWEVDKTKFNCYTPVMIEQMFTSGAVEMNREVEANLLIIGLGAGSLNSYLHATYPKITLTGIELEQQMVRIARKWFGLVLDNRQRVYTMDGIKYIRMAVRQGRKYDAVLLDACLADPNLELNCPIEAFLQADHVKAISKAITEKGVVIANVVSFKINSTEAAGKVKAVYEKVFRNCITITAENSPPNMVVSCTQNDRPGGLEKRYAEFLRTIA